MTSERRKEMVRTWHERGIDSETICRLLGLSADEVTAIIFSKSEPEKRSEPEFTEPTLFGDD
ncbi:hypothetical protein [Bifidobacterium olomucense]|uniref:Uncharacterized protein n=1 Tax=Bifidobacterium olomucense TaxID=2675324 RepID=A0A7Y0HX96_9BIFI|nr:hypothetical protein [Bifidobacterium sp. DSM 109959]NMM98102.1 hypothetical protein [Bifidobacterium sp. DSM 109959]